MTASWRAGASGKDDPPSPDELQLTTLITEYENSLNSGDAVGAAACFTPDGVLMQTMLPTARGGELVEAYAQGFARRSLRTAFAVDEIEVVGPHAAYALTHSVGTVMVHATGDVMQGHRREMFLFRRDAGTWRIARYLFNHDVEPAPDAAPASR